MGMRRLILATALWLPAAAFGQNRPVTVRVEVAPVPAPVGGLPLSAQPGALPNSPTLSPAGSALVPAPTVLPVAAQGPSAAIETIAAGESRLAVQPLAGGGATVRAPASETTAIRPIAPQPFAGKTAAGLAASRGGVAKNARARAADGKVAAGTPEAWRGGEAREQLPALAARPGLAPAAFDGGGKAREPSEPVAGREASIRSELIGGRAAEPEPAKPAPPAPAPAHSDAEPKGWRYYFGGPGERGALALAMLWHAITIGAMYLVNPVATAFLNLNFGDGATQAIARAFMVSAVGSAVGALAYGSLSRLGRSKQLAVTLGVLAASLGAWWWFGPVIAATKAGAFWFYAWSDLFSIMSVVAFWGYVNVLFRGPRAKRFFGALVAAGSIGAIVASKFMHAAVGAIGNLPMLLIAAVLTILPLGLMLALDRWKDRQPAEPEAASAAPAEKPSWKAALRALWASRLLRLVLLAVMLERLVPDFGKVIYNNAIRTAYAEPVAQAAAMALFNFWQGWAQLFVGLGLTALVLRYAGAATALAAPGVANAVGMVLYSVSPGLAVAMGFSAVEGVMRYTTFKAAKEASYSVAPRGLLFHVKAFIDLFVYRAARGLAGLLIDLLTRFAGFGVVGLAVVGAALAGVWTYVSILLGLEVRRLEREEAPRS